LYAAGGRNEAQADTGPPIVQPHVRRSEDWGATFEPLGLGTVFGQGSAMQAYEDGTAPAGELFGLVQVWTGSLDNLYGKRVEVRKLACAPAQ
jgi:hypothetical protein